MSNMTDTPEIHQTTFEGGYSSVEIIDDEAHKEFVDFGAKFVEVPLLLILSHPRIINITRFNESKVILPAFPMTLYDVINREPIIMFRPELAPIYDICVNRDGSAKRTIKSAVLMDVFKQLLDALQYLHSRGVIHGDLKAHNIMAKMIDGKLEVVLIDFNLSKIITKQPLNSMCQSPDCRAPEIVFDDIGGYRLTLSHYDGSVDVWALGIIMWFALTGKILSVDVEELKRIEAMCCGRDEECVEKTISMLMNMNTNTNNHQVVRAIAHCIKLVPRKSSRELAVLYGVSVSADNLIFDNLVAQSGGQSAVDAYNCAQDAAMHAFRAEHNRPQLMLIKLIYNNLTFMQTNISDDERLTLFRYASYLAYILIDDTPPDKMCHFERPENVDGFSIDKLLRACGYNILRGV